MISERKKRKWKYSRNIFVIVLKCKHFPNVMEYIHFEKVCIEYVYFLISCCLIYFVFLITNFTFNIFHQQEGSLCAQHCLNSLLQGLSINLDLKVVYYDV